MKLLNFLFSFLFSFLPFNRERIGNPIIMGQSFMSFVSSFESELSWIGYQGVLAPFRGSKKALWRERKETAWQVSRLN